MSQGISSIQNKAITPRTLVILISLILLISGCNQILQVTIALPPSLAPYYEWILVFPGWLPPIEKPEPIEIWIEFSKNQSWLVSRVKL